MENELDLSSSFVDLMTSLAIIFILLLVGAMNQQNGAGANNVKELKAAVAVELRKIGLDLKDDPQDPFTEIISLDEDKVKFDTKSAELKKSGSDMVSHLFITLAPALTNRQLSDKIESVIVEGNTDSVGNNSLQGKLDNLKLSQDRAFAVMSRGFKSLDERNMKNEEEHMRSLMSAIGRGSSRPRFDPNLSKDANDALSRRVEIKIRVKTGQDLKSALKAT